ncbi:MAG: hypothetical protein IJY50_06525 [Clostridia bacterium]|nr:hypothetical protein [Clostridia bacterium]
MMKKIICLVLGLLMVLSVLTSCSNANSTEDIVDEASRETASLNLWVITESELVASISDLAIAGLDPAKSEDKLTEEEKAQLAALSNDQKEALTQVLAVNKALNKITKAKFKTLLNVKYVTEAEYYTKIEKAFADHAIAIEEAKAAAKAEREALKNGETLAEETEEAGETVVNEHGIPELKYPEAAPYQVDILFIGNYDKYREYVDNEWLVTLDDKLENSAMQISYYVNQIFLTSSMYTGGTYAVPNNTTIGDYTYLCVKTEEMERYGYTLADFQQLSIYNDTFHEFLGKVRQKCEQTAENKVYPIYSANGQLDLSMIHYWSFAQNGGSWNLDHNKFSIFGGTYNNYTIDEKTNEAYLTSRGDQIPYANLLTNDSNYIDLLKMKNEYEDAANGYMTSDEANKTTAATCVVKGGWELKQQYEKMGYQVLVMENPRADDEIYRSMFALGAYTNEENRAMEIITYLNTNAEFRNLLQYGIEGTNYTLSSVSIENEEGIAEEYYYINETDNNLYKMDVNKTGNVFLAYPDSKESVLEWEYGKQQNLDAATYPTLGLYFDLESYWLDEKSVQIVNAVSERVGALVLNMNNEQLDALRAGASAVKSDNAAMAAYLLELTGNDMTYTVGAETKTFTVEELTAALTCVKNGRIIEDPNEKDDTKPLQSPYALYVNWLTNSGIRG